MFKNQYYDRNNDINANFNGYNDVNMDVDINVENTSNKEQMYMPGSSQQPIIEPMQERIVHRTIMHEVPHICPMRTKIINNHVFRHTYSPSYSCCEENVCTNVQCGSCCGFNK